jgi:thioredoxin reductase
MSYSYDVVAIGGGPAGLCAAIEVAKMGAKAAVFDENSRPGGQLFKQIHKFFGSESHQAGTRGFEIGSKLLEEAEKYNVDIHLNTAVVGIFKENPFKLIAVNNGKKSNDIIAKAIIIAAGGSENPLAFPGWTLPGVMGAGAAQTMINIYRTLPGKRVLMVGSGNVGLIVSYQLLQAGAQVVALVEAMPKIGGYGVHAAKISRRGVPILCSHTILSAEGEKFVERAAIAQIDCNFQPDLGSKIVLNVDTVCLAVGLNPMSELCRQVGCKMMYISAIGGYVPIHNYFMETSIPGIFVAGDVAGIEEASTAMEEGRLAGIGAAIRLGFNEGGRGIASAKEIWAKVNALRSGIFGEKRAMCKAEILNAGRGICGEE